jgi:hypothetical protein
MRRSISCAAMALAVCILGCGRDIQDVADQHVQRDLLDRHEKRAALTFFEQKGQFFDVDANSHVDREIVVPLLKRIKELAPTEQWAMLRPEKQNSAYAMLVKLPKDRKVVDQIAEAVQEADDNFPGLILQQWGREWLLFDLIDQQAYETLKKSNPDIDQQR